MSVPLTGYNELINQEKPAITPPENTEVKPSRADELMQRLLAVREAPPVPDTDKANRIARMGRLNTLAQGVGVLGDILTHSIGGNVRRRQPDRITPMLYQQYSQMMDQQKQADDAYRFRDLQAQRANLQTEMGYEQRKDDKKEQDKRWKAQMDAANAKTQMDWQKYIAGYNQKGAIAIQNSKDKALDRELKSSIASGQQAVGWAGVADKKEAATAKSEAAAAKAAKPLHPIEVLGPNGEAITKSEAEWSALYDNAIRDKEFTGGPEGLKAMMTQFAATPDKGLMQIARDYYYYNQRKQKAAAQYPNNGLMIDKSINDQLNKTYKATKTGVAADQSTPKQAVPLKIADIHKDIQNDPELKGVKIRPK